MKKKRLSLLLVATMVFSLCACGSPDGNGNSGAQISVEQSDPIESTDSNEEDEPSDEELKPDYDVEEQVLLDTGGITITATGLSLNEFYGYLELNLTVSNQTDTDITVGLNSADIDVPVGVGSYAYLNGFQVSATALIDVPAQSSTDDTCTFHWDDLIAAGIDEVSQIELGFDIHDQDYNHIVTGSQGLCTLQTTLEGSMDTELSDDMALLLDAEGWQIYGKYVPADESAENDKGHILAVCRNNTDSPGQIHFKEISVDGTVLTYEADIGGTLNIGNQYYENPGHAVVSKTSFAAADNVPDISDSSVITATLETFGPETGDYTDTQPLGTVTFPIGK